MSDIEEIQPTPLAPVTHVASTAENDWWLQRLVSLVSSSDVTFGISLHIGGAIVTGQLAGGKQYFEATAASFGAVFDKNIYPEGDGRLQEYIASFTKIYVNEDGTYKQDQSDPHFIHIKNARVFDAAGNALPSQGDGVWWRGRIREVSGFWFGELQKT